MPLEQGVAQCGVGTSWVLPAGREKSSSWLWDAGRERGGEGMLRCELSVTAGRYPDSRGEMGVVWLL